MIDTPMMAIAERLSPQRNNNFEIDLKEKETMAITAETRKTIIDLVVGAYGTAPGTTLLASLVAKSEAGKSIDEIATILTTSDTFNAIYPTFQTSGEFGAEFLANILPGASADALAEGVTIVEGLMAAGGTRADVVKIAVQFLAQLDEADPAIGTYAAAFNNKVEAATYYTLTLEQAAEGTKAALDAVTADQATVTAANATASTTAASVAGSTFTLTTGADVKTLGSGDDTVSAGPTTLTSGDILDGGAGTDTFRIVDAGTKDFSTSVGAKISGFEIVEITNTNTASATGATEKASLTVSGLKKGQDLQVAGETLTATADITAATVATALAGSAASGTGWTLAGTLTGYTKAAGGNSTSVVYTSSTATTNVTDLSVGGSAVTGNSSVRTLSLATNPGNVDNTLSVFVNGTTVTTVAAGATNASGLATLTNDLAAKINGAAGSVVATSDGVSQITIINDGSLAIGSVSGAGTSNTTSGTLAFSPNKTTLTLSTDPGATTAQTGFINGVAYSTAVLGSDAVDAAGAAHVAAINTAVGRTVATYTDATNKLVIDNGAFGGIALRLNSTGSTTASTAIDTATTGATSASPTEVSITQGVAAAGGAGDTVAASGFSGAESFVNSLSESKVTFSSLSKTQELTIKGNGSVTNGQTVASFASSATAPVVNIEGGVTGSPALTVTGVGASSSTINSSAAPLTSTGKIGTNSLGAVEAWNTAVSVTGTLTINAESNLSMRSLATKAATIDLNGAGSVTIANSSGTAQAIVDANLATIDASDLEGGVKLALNTQITSFKGGKGKDTVTTAAISSLASIAAGDGVDTLVIGTATDLNSAVLGAKYTGFEVLVGAVGGALSGTWVPSVVALATVAGTSITNLNATQAMGLSTLADSGSLTVALTASSGTTDQMAISLNSAADKEAADIAGALTVTGFETINLKASPSSSAVSGAAATSTIGSFSGTSLTAINLTGSAFDLSNLATTLPVVIDGTALTGDRAVTPKGLTVAGSAVAKSVINGSDHIDTFTIGAEGSTYNGGAGDDVFTTSVTILTADGTTDLKIDGGTNSGKLTSYQDQLVVSDAAATLTDNQFTYVTGFETLKLNGTGDQSLTTGGAFNTAFADGVSIITGTLSATKDIQVVAGLSSVNTSITVDATSLTGAATETSSIVTGSGNDKVKFTGDASYVGVLGAAQGTIVITTAAGDDKITVTLGDLVSGVSTTGNALVITPGTGADTVTMTKDNGVLTTGSAHIVIGYGDSVFGTHDKVTGFDVADGTDIGDKLDFGGTGAVASSLTTNDFGTITSHALSNGVATFDDASSFVEKLLINSTNVADVIGYLDANTATNGTVGFEYDSTSDGAVDSFIVFHKGGTGVSNDTVQLIGIATGEIDGLSATVTTVTNDYIIIA